MPEVDGLVGVVAGASLGPVVEVEGLVVGVEPSGAASAVLGAVAVGGALGLVSALAGRASITARNGTAIRVRNSGKKAVERRIC